MNNFTVYLYQQDFISLLKLLIFLTNHNIRPGDIKNKNYEPNLLDEVHHFALDKTNDEIEKLLKQMSSLIFSRMYYVFLSNHPKKELILYYFFLNFKKYGNQVVNRRNLKCVSEVLRISQYVSHEAHKLKGFIRFQETDNSFLYSEIEPENNVLEIVSNHFKKRLKNELWIIKDKKRGLISVYDKKEFSIYSEKNLHLFEFKDSTQEKEMQKLWRQFYEMTGIKERKNDRCRMNFMPKKYWKHMTEMRDKL